MSVVCCIRAPARYMLFKFEYGDVDELCMVFICVYDVVGDFDLCVCGSGRWLCMIVEDM